METVTQWKKWHKIVLGIIGGIIFIVILIVINADKNPKTATASLSKEQQDSITNKIKMDSAFEEGRLNLIVLIKQNMNDPESFEYVEANGWKGDSDKIIIKMKYRGKNGFGGTMTEIVRAIANMKGDILKTNRE